MASTPVVDNLDPTGDSLAHVSFGGPSVLVVEFVLQCGPKRFGNRVVEAHPRWVSDSLCKKGWDDLKEIDCDQDTKGQ